MLLAHFNKSCEERAYNGTFALLFHEIVHKNARLRQSVVHGTPRAKDSRMVGVASEEF